MAEPSKQCSPGGDFDQAVQSKTDQGHGPGDESSDDGDETFSTVVGDCDEFELLASADEVLPAVQACCRHRAIISNRSSELLLAGLVSVSVRAMRTHHCSFIYHGSVVSAGSKAARLHRDGRIREIRSA
jgi:hypothetical protein